MIHVTTKVMKKFVTKMKKFFKPPKVQQREKTTPVREEEPEASENADRRSSSDFRR